MLQKQWKQKIIMSYQLFEKIIMSWQQKQTLVAAL